MANTIPNVSVIVPMYNAEKYIGELLDSVLAQTLKNFEIIIVDDGSTDKSCEVVESYLKKFGGRLNLVHSKKNAGHPAEPRNRGLALSRGKYVFFMDADDALTKTGLEEMFNAAEKFQADVIYCKYNFTSDGVGKNFFKKLKGGVPNNDKQAVTVTEDLAVRADAWIRLQFRVEPWLKLVRRDFLVESGVQFLPVFQDDSIWTLEVLCTAKKVFAVPLSCYIYRLIPDSFSKVQAKSQADIVKNIRRKMERTIRALKHLDEFLGKIDFFQEHANHRYALIANFMTIDLNWLQNECFNLQPHIVQEICQKEFAPYLGEHGALVSHLFSRSILLTRELIVAQQKIRSLDR